MRKAVNSAVAYLTIFSVMLVVSQLGAIAATQARLEGLIVGIDGKAAPGYTIHLIDDSGAVLRSSTTDENGVYSFVDLPAGSYGLGIETPEGTMAPVAVPPIEVGAGELARRDIKLLEADAATAARAATTNYAVGGWWAGLSGGAKAGVIIGIAAVGYGAYAAFDDDEDEASPIVPEPF
jgi:hypothetical protein